MLFFLKSFFYFNIPLIKDNIFDIEKKLEESRKKVYINEKKKHFPSQTPQLSELFV